MGIVLDSSVIIAAERSGQTVDLLIERIAAQVGDQEAAISAIGLTELVHGVYRARTAAARDRREAFLRELITVLTVYPYTAEIAWLAGRLDAEQQANGVVIPYVDLLIGATALSLGFSVLTLNARDFSRIPHLTVKRLEQGDDVSG